MAAKSKSRKKVSLPYDTPVTSPPPWQVATLYGVVLIVGASVMAFEILTSRVIAPYFGSSTYTWGNLIGVILCSMTLGYWLGGKLANRYSFGMLPSFFLWVAGILVTLMPFTAHHVSLAVQTLQLPTQYGVLLVLLLLCLLPACLMTTVFPFAAHRAAAEGKSFGELTGKLGIASSMGSLLGTFLTTLVLVNLEWLGTRKSLMLTGLTIFLCGVALGISLLKRSPLRWKMSLGLLLLCQFSGLNYGWAQTVPPLVGSEVLLEERDSPYHSIRVVEFPATVHGRPGEVRTARILRFADPFGDQSGVYLGEPGEPTTNLYIELFFLAWALRSDIQHIAIVGAGGGIMARDILRYFPAGKFPNLRLDVIDIDGHIFSVAERFFGYPVSDSRLKSHVMDGRMFFQSTRETYDLVLLDAYSSASQIPEHLVTKEFFSEVHGRLKEGGIVAMNVFLPSDMEEHADTRLSRKFLSLLKTFHQSFAPERTLGFATAKLRDDWTNRPVINRGGVVLTGVRGAGSITPDFNSLSARMPDFRSVTGKSLDSLTVSMLPPSLLSPKQTEYVAASVLTDDFNPINLFSH